MVLAGLVKHSVGNSFGGLRDSHRRHGFNIVPMVADFGLPIKYGEL